MDAMLQSAGNRVYEDFEPGFEWQRDETAATLIVFLSGFRTDQLKVQVTSTPMVKLMGEQQIRDNKWRRILKEFSIPSECDTNEVSAKFERGRLYIKFSLKPSKSREEEAKPSNEVSEQKEETVTEKKKEEEGDGGEEEKKKKKATTSGVVESMPPPPPSSEALTSKNNGEKLGATRQGSLIERAKTRVLDYTISVRPSLESEDLKKPENWVNIILLFLFAVVLVIYLQQALRAFLGVISNKF